MHVHKVYCDGNFPVEPSGSGDVIRKGSVSALVINEPWPASVYQARSLAAFEKVHACTILSPLPLVGEIAASAFSPKGRSNLERASLAWGK
jgi:hypothetical protein